jgi:hypothetical protein
MHCLIKESKHICWAASTTSISRRQKKKLMVWQTGGWKRDVSSNQTPVNWAIIHCSLRSDRSSIILTASANYGLIVLYLVITALAPSINSTFPGNPSIASYCAIPILVITTQHAIWSNINTASCMSTSKDTQHAMLARQMLPGWIYFGTLLRSIHFRAPA